MRLEFPFNLYAIGLTAAFLVSFATLPAWRRLAVRVGLVDAPGHRKIHSTAIPLAGGWTVAGALAGAFFLGATAIKLGLLNMAGAGGAQELLRYGVSKRGGQLAVILAGAFGMAL